jgi:microsomal prostaglandin-E synthase 1
VTPLVHQPVFVLYTICSLIVVAGFYVLAYLTGTIRMARKAVVNGEDVKVYEGASVVETEHPDVQRVKRAHLNLIENAVPFFVVGLLYALASPPLALAAALYLGFVGARLLHALCYLTGRQPARAACWAAGVLIILVMSVHTAKLILS